MLGLSLLVVSDVLFPILIVDPDRLRQAQAAKGAIEILISGGVIYALVSRSHQAIRTNRARYEALVEHLPNGVVMLFDEELRYTVVGGADLEELGLTPEEMEGRQPTDVFPSEIGSKLEANGREALDGTEHAFEIDLQDRYYQVRTAPIQDASGTITTGIAVAQDITERREREQTLKQREQTYRNLVENSPVPINLFDEDGTTVWGNEAVVELLGLEDQEALIGRSIFEFIHPEDRPIAEEELWQVVEQDEIVGPTTMRIVRADGEIRHIQVLTAGGWYQGERVGQAVVNDVTTLRETEEELRRNEQRYRTLVEMSPDPILVHIDGEIVYANDAAADVVDRDTPECLHGVPITRYLHPDEYEDAEKTARLTQQGELRPTSNERVLITADERTRYVEATSRAIAYEDDPAVLTIIKDVTERRQYEETLTTLHHRTREILGAEDRETIGELVVEAFTELLDLEAAFFYEFDGQDRLVPIARSVREKDSLTSPPITREDGGVLWESFATGDERLLEEIPSADRPASFPLTSAFVLPISNHGLVVTGETTAFSLTVSQREIAQLITENLDAALDRAQRERNLRKRDQQLRQQNESLEQLNRLNEIIREINQTLVRSSTRPAIKKNVCENLADATEYTFAWFGTIDPDIQAVEPQYWEGVSAEYIDQLGAGDSSEPIETLVQTAFRNGTVQVAQDILNDPAWAIHRQEALNHGYSSLAAIPIPTGDHIESILVIHASEDTLFDEEEVAVLEELGQTIGYALRNVDRVEAIRTDERTTIEIQIDDSGLVTNGLTTELDTDLEFIGAIENENDADSLDVFVRLMAVTAETVARSARDLETVQKVDVLSADEESSLCRLTVERPSLIEIIQRHDSRLVELTSVGGSTTCTIALTGNTDVRPFVEEFRSVYTTVDLLARHQETTPIETRETFRQRLLDALTEKQFDCLRTAFFGGFYEWPRTTTNEELAETRDIAASTFQYHLRAAERKVVSAVLEPG